MLVIGTPGDGPGAPLAGAVDGALEAGWVDTLVREEVSDPELPDRATGGGVIAGWWRFCWSGRWSAPCWYPITHGPDFLVWATLLFIVLSKVVIEQYLTWPLPLAHPARGQRPLAGRRPADRPAQRRRVPGEPLIHPWGTRPGVIDILLAAAILTGLFPLRRRSWLHPPGRPGLAGGAPADQPAG